MPDENRSKQWQVFILYGFLALIILGPILEPGFVLTLDLVFTPKLTAASGISNTYLFTELLHILNFALPAQAIEKIIIFLLLFLCGFGMHCLVKTKDEWPKYFAGVLYMINPFTYERWMAGQYLVIAGYALLPFLLKSLISFYANPKLNRALHVGVWFTLIALFSLQSFVLGVLLAIILLIICVASRPPQKHYYRRLFKYGGLVVTSFLILSSYWLYGVISGKSSISQTINNIGSRDLSAFATASHAHVGLFFNVLSMYGFWLERYGRYAMPNHIAVIWFIGFALIAALVAMGVYAQKKVRSLIGLCIGIAGVIGLIVALGVNVPVSGPVVRWGLLHVPLMRGFRDTEKFSALLVLAYSYFAAYGLDWLIIKIKSRSDIALEIVRDGAVLLPLVYTSTMPFGFADQLKPVNYPASWYSYNQQLKENPPSGKVLFLPWDEYSSYDFTPRIIANPAPDFFQANIISGTDAEFGGAVDPDPTPTSTFIEQQVLAKAYETNLGATLAKLNVQYVLLAHGYDFASYNFLNKQTDLKLISNQRGLEVYQNEAYYHG